MHRAIPIRRLVARETILALLVLALCLFNFGHASLAFAGDGSVVSIAHAYCGDPIAPVDGDHAPCHACRIGAGLALPPPPLAIAPLAFAVAPTLNASGDTPLAGPPLIALAQPRAPPFA